MLKSVTPLGPSRFIILKNKVQKYSESLPNNIIVTIQNVTFIRKMCLIRYLYQNDFEALMIQCRLKRILFTDQPSLGILQLECTEKDFTSNLRNRESVVSSFIITQAGTSDRLIIFGKRLTLGKLFYTAISQPSAKCLLWVF